MSNSIVAKARLPRAIAKEKDGVVLYWVEELGIAGLSFRGFERLLECDHRTASNLIQGGEVGCVVEAETVTDSGLQVVKLIPENSLAELLTTVISSKCKAKTRKNAASALSALAAAGFKLLVMMELAPHQLKAKVDAHVSEVDKILEIERLRYKTQELHGSMLTMHGDAWLALQGVGVAERETVVTEIVQPEQNKSTKVLSANQLKRAVKDRTGQNVKSMAEFTRALRAAGRDDLLVPVTRHQTCEYVAPESLDEAIAVVYARSRQSLVGEQYA